MTGPVVAPPSETTERGTTGLYPEDVITPTPGLSAGAAIATILAVVVAILLVLMTSGYNDSVPYLHPATTQTVTVAGDRESFQYLFTNNGTTLNQTVGTLCPRCPFSLGPGARFSYTFNVTNGFNASMEVRSVTAASSFLVLAWSPSSTLLAPGLTLEFTLTVQAPTQSGVYVLPLAVTVDVS